MDRNTAIKIITGEAHAKLAEGWFKFLGFVALTAVFHAAAAKTDHLILEALKWICYIFLFRWTNFKIDQLIWLLFPSTNPVSKRRKEKNVIISVFISTMIMLFVYFLVLFLINSFLGNKGV